MSAGLFLGLERCTPLRLSHMRCKDILYRIALFFGCNASSCVYSIEDQTIRLVYCAQHRTCSQADSTWKYDQGLCRYPCPPVQASGEVMVLRKPSVYTWAPDVLDLYEKWSNWRIKFTLLDIEIEVLFAAEFYSIQRKKQVKMTEKGRTKYRSPDSNAELLTPSSSIH